MPVLKGEPSFLHSADPTLDVSVVVVSHNTRDILRETLQSAVDSLGAPGRDNFRWEIWVSDNASTDGSPDMVAKVFPFVRLIRNANNVGFSAGNNQAIRQSRGRNLLLLNSDTVSPPGALPEIVKFLDDMPRAGACSPRLLCPDHNPQRFAWGGEPTPAYLLRRRLLRLLFRKDLHDWGVQRTLPVDWVSGACMAVRREVVEKVGLMDETFFVYFEDVDWCRRIRLAGWKVFVVPSVEIVHIGGATLNATPWAAAEYRRSLRLYYRKHYGAFDRFLAKLLIRQS